MDKKTVVNLLHKSIEELKMITDGFMEISEYPAALLLLARNKTEDIQNFFNQLEDIKEDKISTEAIHLSAPIEESDKKPDFPETNTEDTHEFLVSENEEEKTIEVVNDDVENTIETASENLVINTKEENVETTKESITTETENELIETTVEYYSTRTVDTVVEKEKEPLEENITQSEDSNASKPQAEEKVLSQDVQQQSQHKLLNTIGDTHTNGKINDIRQAMSIGDRFRFQRDLFNGSGEELNKTLAHLNQLHDFDQAVQFIQSKFQWDEEDSTVESFLLILRRRYL